MFFQQLWLVEIKSFGSNILNSLMRLVLYIKVRFPLMLMLASHVMLMLDSPVNVTRDTTNDFRAVAVDRTKEEKETNGHLSDDDYEQFGGLFFSFQFNSSKTFFYKKGLPRPLFRLFLVFFSKQCKIYNKLL